MMNYRDFSLKLDWVQAAVYQANVLDSPAGQGSLRFNLPFSETEIAELLRDLEKGLLDGRERRTENSIRAFGTQLYDTIISGPVRSLYDQSLGSLSGTETGLRIKLQIDFDESQSGLLTSLPWEFLYSQEQRAYLTLVPRTSIVRYAPAAGPVPRSLAQPMRVLVVLSSPRDMPALDFGAKREGMERAWRQLENVQVSYLDAPTLLSFNEQLSKETYHVLHYVGLAPGMEEERCALVLEDETGHSQWVDAETLGVVLRGSPATRLILLDTRESALPRQPKRLGLFHGMASSLVRAGLSAVVAMQYPMSDRSSAMFSERVYALLAQGEPIDYAVAQGRRAIRLASTRTLEWAAPVLYMRVPDGLLFGTPDLSEQPSRESREQDEPGPRTGDMALPEGQAQAQLGADLETALQRESVNDALDLARQLDDPEARGQALVRVARGLPQSEQAEVYAESLTAFWSAFSAAQEAVDLEGAVRVRTGVEALYQEIVEHDLALEVYSAAVDLARREGDRQWEAKALVNVGGILHDRSEWERSREALEQALAAFQDADDPSGAADCARQLGRLAREQEDYAEAERQYEAALAAYRDLDDQANAALCGGELGWIALSRGDAKRAWSHFEESVRAVEGQGDQHALASLLAGLGRAQFLRGDAESSQATFQRSLDLARELGFREVEAQALRGLGRLAGERRDAGGDPNDALARLQQSRDIYDELGDPRGLAWVEYDVGRVFQNGGVIEEAEKRYRASRAGFERAGFKLGAANAMGRLGQVLAIQGRADEARDVLKRSAAILDGLGFDMLAGEVRGELSTLPASAEREPRVWLVTADPDHFRWERAQSEGGVAWTGVHAKAALDHLAQSGPGDVALAYASSPQTAIVGVGWIAGEPYAWDGRQAVRIALGRLLGAPLPLDALRAVTPDLDHVRRTDADQRPLSFSPVTPGQWTVIRQLILEFNPDLPPDDLPLKGREASELVREVRALLASGVTDRALSTARRFASPELREWALEQIAPVMARQGSLDPAVRTAKEIEVEDRQARALSAVCEAWVESGAPGDAEQVASAIAAPRYRSVALSAVAQAYAARDDLEGAARAGQAAWNSAQESQGGAQSAAVLGQVGDYLSMGERLDVFLVEDLFGVQKAALESLYRTVGQDAALQSELRALLAGREPEVEVLLKLAEHRQIRGEVKTWLGGILDALLSPVPGDPSIEAGRIWGEMEGRPDRERAATLARIGGDLSIEVLRNTLLDSSFGVRKAALEAMRQRIGDDEDEKQGLRDWLAAREAGLGDLRAMVRHGSVKREEKAWLDGLLPEVKTGPAPAEKERVEEPVEKEPGPIEGHAIGGGTPAGEEPAPVERVAPKSVSDLIPQQTIVQLPAITAQPPPADLLEQDILDVHITPRANRDPWPYQVVLYLRSGEHIETYEGPFGTTLSDLERIGPVEQYGRALFDALFAKEAEGEGASPWEGYIRILSRAQKKEGVRVWIRVNTETPELHEVRWEYLWGTDLSAECPLGCSSHTPLARVLHVQRPRHSALALDEGRPLRILAALASPRVLEPGQPRPRTLLNLAPIREGDLGALESSLARVRKHLGPVVEDLEKGNVLRSAAGPVSVQAIRRRLQEARDLQGRPVHVLHLMCHGVIRPGDGKACLVLDHDGGEPVDLVSEDDFSKALADLVAGEARDGLRLVVLASCLTASVTGEQALRGIARQLVARGVPAVVAMQGLFRIEAAQHFTERLYTHLIAYGEIDRAVNAARNEVYLKRRRGVYDREAGRVPLEQYGLPVLFTNMPKGRLFEPNPARQADADGAETDHASYDQLPYHDERQLQSDAAHLAAIHMAPQTGMALPTLVEQLAAAVRQIGQAPAAARLPRPDHSLFVEDGGAGKRCALIRAAAQHRRHPARRAVLFVRECARARIAELAARARLERAAGNSDGLEQFQQDYRAHVLSAPPAGWEHAAGAGPAGENEKLLDANARELRAICRGFGPDGEPPAGGPAWPEALGRLWEDPVPGGAPPDPKRLLDLLDAHREEASGLFARLTAPDGDGGAGLDEGAASLLLHAIVPERCLPYSDGLARELLGRLELAAHPRYQGYEGWLLLARDLLTDDDLEFHDLGDVWYFLQRLHAGFLDWDETQRGELPLQEVGLQAEGVDSALVFDEGVIEQAVTALNAGKHVILIGPPGTGKTTLAEDLCRCAQDLGCSRGHVLVTATADWTTFDTIGGYLPQEDNRLAFRPGVFLEAIDAHKWLVIDEINRADIDKAFGELFTVLSGQAVTLPYRQNGDPVCILPPHHPGTEEARNYAIDPGWRIIGTMNVYDKASLFGMSLAFMRRFAFIDVELPAQKAYDQLLEGMIKDAGLDPEEIGSRLKRVFNYDKGEQEVIANALMRYRALGPAMAKDIAEYLGQRLPDPQDVKRRHLAEALLLYVIPQFEGLDRDSILRVYRGLHELFEEDGLKILERIEELFPFVSANEFRTAREGGTTPEGQT